MSVLCSLGSVVIMVSMNTEEILKKLKDGPLDVFCYVSRVEVGSGVNKNLGGFLIHDLAFEEPQNIEKLKNVENSETNQKHSSALELFSRLSALEYENEIYCEETDVKEQEGIRTSKLRVEKQSEDQKKRRRSDYLQKKRDHLLNHRK